MNGVRALCTIANPELSMTCLILISTSSLLLHKFKMDPTTLTGLLLIIVPVAFNVTFFLLQRAFEYPDILRKPTDHILRRFKEGGASLRLLWYAFTFSAVLFTPV